jgi:hypothetical protein
MHVAFTSDESEIFFEARKRGNSAYFLPTFLDARAKRTTTGPAGNTRFTAIAGMSRAVQ